MVNILIFAGDFPGTVSTLKHLEQVYSNPKGIEIGKILLEQLKYC
jgi:hypothetical protein